MISMFRNIILGLVVGLAVGLWFGVNIGRDQPLYSNPFESKSVQEKLKDTGKEVLKKSGEAIEEGGKALKQSFE